MPATRGECVGGVRPCPYRLCRHHLDRQAPMVGPPSRVRPPHVGAQSCSLDVADNGPLGLDDVGYLLNLSRERARQLEVVALQKLARRLPSTTGLSAADLAIPWSRAEGYTESDDWFDFEFKAAVHRAYERIVPADERGAKALRSMQTAPKVAT